ncbi:hypothetical protein FDP41_000009 [Naegleria fowleri]|uniref:Methyltransferase domain-containing protein n=1 Tax=Naegleria fowleri TaxID=5763 RepID=A0A6A5CHI9_NAEFO|nr:uncharacterized protein FDP41_000009 [Naegleria fowleri]KAF0984970.1 hypothetical protein FDP41_000009 [Naegleria fowleri]CAG4712245.1 unnamed protein product [Naegleria fowleri]
MSPQDSLAPNSSKLHWEKVYTEKPNDHQVSWFQESPETSLTLIDECLTRLTNDHQNESSTPIITLMDIGSGNSNLVIELLKQTIAKKEQGNVNNKYIQSFYLVDISGAALERTRQKLFKQVSNEQIQKENLRVEFVESNVLLLEQHSAFHSNSRPSIDIWHDRATFHFLTDEKDQLSYLKIVSDLLKVGGYFVLATFSSNNGPKQCSGLPIVQYDVEKLGKLLEQVKDVLQFELAKSFEQIHVTPFNTQQNFLFCVFQRVK